VNHPGFGWWAFVIVPDANPNPKSCSCSMPMPAGKGGKTDGLIPPNLPTGKIMNSGEGGGFGRGGMTAMSSNSNHMREQVTRQEKERERDSDCLFEHKPPGALF
jgi:hypothetical protein